MNYLRFSRLSILFGVKPRCIDVVRTFAAGVAFIGVDSRVAKRSDVQTECNGDVAIGGSHNTVHRTRPMGQGVLTVLKKDLLSERSN